MRYQTLHECGEIQRLYGTNQTIDFQKIKTGSRSYSLISVYKGVVIGQGMEVGGGQIKNVGCFIPTVNVFRRCQRGFRKALIS